MPADTSRRKPQAHYRPDPESHPPVSYPAYRSNVARAPKHPLVLLPQRLGEITGPLLGEERVGRNDNDLTVQHGEEPQGQRIIVGGRVLDGDGRAIPNTLVEVWQANAGGRYRHDLDRHPAPLDPNFSGVGRTMTDADGNYRFITIAPGAYPWKNHHNAWRPAHIHFSVFGRAFTQRLITQMYFPGDPLFDQDPIFTSARPAAREAMVAKFDLDSTVPEWAVGYLWDIVLRGSDPTPFEDEEDHDDE
ncbi:protocatechuate 3,4-dioxygenase subunit beta [Umezawaea sp. Da 62-37]|uniref:protocatechuate 3,4-dioxygenase subunit beta n=1 Tax=Umezawaea sp. Da 62-37 TaxID=3075927 RepID=UPI0028F6C53F|nr:protocatechuate 3,4-dioxygenase subunit beta [Umezawaea sp. Da 62-37]WNV84357.1 protocatechuate 3,4-dioxygenase subunit beta [Umezawaea sp. Da 62-37]